MFTQEELSTLAPSLRAKVEALTAKVKFSDLKIQQLEEKLRLARIKKYGAAADALDPAQIILLDCEPGVASREVQKEAGLLKEDKEAVRKSVRRTARGQKSLPAHLPRREVIIACAEAECVCAQCNGERKVFGYETTERLHREPTKYFVNVLKREKRACPRCEEMGVTTAPLPPQIIAKGIGSNELVVDVLLAKYELHLPLYRQELQIERESGIELSRQTMSDWVMQSGGLLETIVREQRKDLISGGYIQADETPVGVQSSETKNRNHRGYLWQYSRPYGPVIFDYQDGRSREGPQKMLQGYRGLLQTDGYQVYQILGINGIVHACCWAHVRRDFVDAAKIYKSDVSLAQIIENIAALYAIEARAREAELSNEQRKTLRQRESVPIVAQLKEMILALRKEVLPKSLQAKACDYALKLWPQLETFLSRGEVEIDNNWSENAIRPVALGRKNWLHIGSKAAAPKVAAILSIIETCHRLKVPVRDYLLSVLPQLAAGKSNPADLTPTAWKAAQLSR
jgi:transposase